MFYHPVSRPSSQPAPKPHGEPAGSHGEQPALFPRQQPSSGLDVPLATARGAELERARKEATEQPVTQLEGGAASLPLFVALEGQPAEGCELDDELAHRPAYEAFKRALDVVVATAVLLLAAPLLLLAGLAVRFQDGGPALFWQVRVGQRGRLFHCPKLRSMRVGAEHELVHLASGNHHKSGVVFKMVSDPRVTAIGRVLRKYSVDELPQLWSVLRGEMSLVGPRPPLPDEVRRYSLHQRRRLQVRPGLTCSWQISGRADLDFDRQVELDLDYIARRGALLDLRILVATLPAVVGARGAY